MKRKIKTAVRQAILAAVGLLVLCSPEAWAQNPALDQTQRSAHPKYADDEVLVKFRPDKSATAKQQSHSAVGGHTKKLFRLDHDLELVKLPTGMKVKEALRRYRRDPNVAYAEPNYRWSIALQPNDPSFPSLWGLHNTGQTGGVPDADIDAPEAWSITTGSPDVVIGVIDTGVDYNHSDLAANIWSNSGDCSLNGVDDDGDGYIDDCHGIDTANADSDPMDDHGHGTHVSGTIGATGNNGVGVVGVNWIVRIAACKFLASNGYGWTSDAVDCLDYFAILKDRGVNVAATNNSWGGDEYSQALYDAIQRQMQRGILFVAAAGNSASNNDNGGFYPSGFDLPNVISVAATDSSDALAGFSSYGRHTVHLGAPGVEVLSTVPGGGYGTMSGTSMAAPHVTGVAALLAAQDPARDWKAIKNLIFAGGDTKPAVADTISQKRLNAYGAMICSNSVVLSRLLPRTSIVYATTGEPQLLSALHIDCASPNGAVQVTVDSGASAITLADDGLAPDQAAGDGVYSGQYIWSLADVGDHSLTFPNNDVVTVHVIPPLSPYVYSTAVPFVYRNITAPEIWEPGLVDDETILVTPPFPVQFGSASFTNLYVSNNGVVTFMEPFSSPVNSVLPATGTKTLVAPFWDDLYQNPYSEHGRVFWDVTGSTPNREFVILWGGIGHYGCDLANSASFQIVFFEGSSDILFNYNDVTFGGDCTFADLGASATVGVQVQPGLATQFSFEAPSLSNHSSILWQLGQLTPTITRLSPFTALEGDPSFTLHVFGTNFSSGSVIRWNGSDRPTAFINSTELKAPIPASDVSAAATIQVSVVNPPPYGGDASPEAPFKVYSSHPVPSLTGLSPAGVLVPAAGFTLTVTGSDFVTGSVIRWNGSDRATTVLDSMHATAAIPDSDLADGGLAQVTIFNPAPGGGNSNALTITLENRVPTVTQLQPFTAAVGVAFALQVNGTNFVRSSVVRWNGIDQPTAFISNTQLTASITAADIAAAGDAQVTVVNPAPGGGASNAFPVTVYDAYPAPSITSLDPLMVFAPAYEGLTLSVTGTDFVSASVVRWNGADRPTTVLSPTQVRAQIPESDVLDGSLVQVTVFTPSPGGGTSNSLPFTVTNPVPLIESISPAAVPPGAGFTLNLVSGYFECAHPMDDPCLSTFVPSSVVRWNGADRPTRFLNAERLEATIPASDTASAGTAQITVYTPAPGGGTSTAVPIAIAPRPPNDNFADAIVVSTLPFSHVVNTLTATTEAFEPDDYCFGSVNVFTGEISHPRPNQTVWYRFTPSSNITVRANMIGTNFLASMAALTVNPDSFNLVLCARTDWTPPFNELGFPATAGTTYYFRIDAFAGASDGNLVVNFSVGPETLTVGRAGTGTGSVTSNPTGIDCGSICSASFAGGTVVTLTPVPAAGSAFSAWSGACAGSGPCSVTMDSSKNVTAAFDMLPPFDFGQPPTSETISAGQSAQFSLQMVGQPSFAGSVSFSCTSGLPLGATCSFNPPSVTLGGGAANILLTIRTTARSSAQSTQSPPIVVAYLFAPFAIIVVPWARRWRRPRAIAGFAIVLLVIGTMVACGGGGGAANRTPSSTPLGTPAGTYTITITGISSSTTRAQNVTLVVN
jgi:subtilase family protein/fervidolysin-like protein/List-Bact-rpt repeat protein